MDDLVAKLKAKEGFSDLERNLADFLLENFQRLPAMSTRQLAKETYSSSASIVRFCQKLGFGGYTEFRIVFMTQILDYISRPQAEDHAMTDRDSIHSVLDKVTAQEMDALTKTRQMLDPADFARAYHILSGTHHVDFYATDTNLDIANMAAASFIMADKCCTVHSAMAMQYLLATSAPKEHVGFFISRTGENRMLVDIAHLLELRGLPRLLITSRPDSTLANLADVTFPVATVDTMEELGPRVFLTGAKYVIDVFFAVLMTQVDYHHAQKKDKWLSQNFYY